MTSTGLGEQIKRLRTAKKMTLAVMAERVGVTISAIAAYENGTRNPSFDVLIKIANLFHVSIDNLLGNSNKYMIDTTELTQEQRNVISELVLVYKRHNSMYKNIKFRNYVNINEIDTESIKDFDDWIDNT